MSSFGSGPESHAARALAATRWAWAEVDLRAVEHNVRLLAAAAAPAAPWAVVKANGYGHGAVPVAEAALRAGARGLCVALVAEGIALREAGIGFEVPVLVLSEQPPDAAPYLVAARLAATVYTPGGVEVLAACARAQGVRDHPVHVKVDTGMYRVGAAVDSAADLVAQVHATPGVRLAGVFTHLAVADEPEDAYTARQLDAFDRVLAALDLPDDVLVHAANSAGAMAHTRARRHLVRLGIAMYGLPPGPGLVAASAGLRPALSLRARVSFVKRVPSGARVSYGLRHELPSESTVATVPIGYADGVPRRLYASGGEVLIGGRRRPIVGVVTMDQLLVACGDDDVAVGDDVVLIGRQGHDEITATEWADRLGTINYEITCGISARVPRQYERGR